MRPPAPRAIRTAAAALLAGLFVVAIALPLLDARLGIDRAPGLTENRSPARAPSWPTTWKEVQTFPRAVDAYWNDAFGFRTRLIRWHAIWRYHLGVSPTAKVIAGKDRWLYYDPSPGHDWLRGVEPIPEARLALWKSRLEARRDWLAQRGAKFLFMVAPDKETIYPEKVPDRLRRVRESALGQLVGYLAAHSTVEVLDLRPAVLAARRESEVYSHTDTHWNDRGAYSAYLAIAERIRPWFPLIEPRPLSTFERRDGAPWSGDLAAMVGLIDFLAEPRPLLVPAPAYLSRKVEDRDFRPRDTLRYAVMQGPSPELPRAVVFHDSFFLPPEHRGDPAKPARTDPFMPTDSPFRMVDLLAELFSRSAFSWQHSFDAALVERERPALVIQEQVERMLMGNPSPGP